MVSYSTFNQLTKEKILKNVNSPKFEQAGILYNYLVMLYYRLRIKFIKYPELQNKTCLIKCRIDKNICASNCLRNINTRDYEYIFVLKTNDLGYLGQNDKPNELLIFPNEFIEINLNSIACSLFSFDVLYATATKLLSEYGNTPLSKSKLYSMFKQQGASGYTKISDIEAMIKLNINCIDLGLPEIVEIKNVYEKDTNIIDWFEPYSPLNDAYYQEQALKLYRDYFNIRDNKNIHTDTINYKDISDYLKDENFLKFLSEKYKL